MPRKDFQPTRSVSPCAYFGEMPFSSMEECWLWFAAVCAVKREGGKALGGGVARPLCPEDVSLALSRQMRAGLLSARHAKILRLYGDRGRAPSGDAELKDRALWLQAMRRLRAALRGKRVFLSDFSESRGADFSESRGADFSESRGADFSESRGADFSESRGADFSESRGARQF